MPFAGYNDFADCVAKNTDKGDAKAYCATIMRKVEKPKEKFIFSSSIITESKQDGDKKRMFIIGNAATAGFSRNRTSDGKRILYKEEELKRAAENMVGIPIMLNHDDEDVRKIVGKVVESRYENGNLPYKAEIDTGEVDIVRKLEGGFINRVSIGSDYERLEVKEDAVAPIGLSILELSMVSIAGIASADISQVICEKYEVSKMEEAKQADFETKISALSEKNTQLASMVESLTKKVEEAKAAEKKYDDSGIVKEMAALKEKIASLESKPKGVVEEQKKESGIKLTKEAVGRRIGIYAENLEVDGKWIY